MVINPLVGVYIPMIRILQRVLQWLLLGLWPKGCPRQFTPPTKNGSHGSRLFHQRPLWPKVARIWLTRGPCRAKTQRDASRWCKWHLSSGWCCTNPKVFSVVISTDDLLRKNRYLSSIKKGHRHWNGESHHQPEGLESKQHWLCHYSARLAHGLAVELDSPWRLQSNQLVCFFWLLEIAGRKLCSTTGTAWTWAVPLDYHFSSLSWHQLSHSLKPPTSVLIQLVEGFLEVGRPEGPNEGSTNLRGVIHSPPLHHSLLWNLCRWFLWFAPPASQWRWQDLLEGRHEESFHHGSLSTKDGSWSFDLLLQELLGSPHHSMLLLSCVASNYARQSTSWGRLLHW